MMSGFPQTDYRYVQDDHPLARWWLWRIEARQPSASPGARARFTDGTGLIRAEGAGEALHWLVAHGPMWEGVDIGYELTLTITPVPRYDDGEITLTEDHQRILRDCARTARRDPCQPDGKDDEETANDLIALGLLGHDAGSPAALTPTDEGWQLYHDLDQR
jgi:hypothetical protein